MIKIKDLKVGYNQEILQLSKLEISQDIYFVVGKNGAGKSTFLKTISGQIPSISGEIQIDGVNINGIANDELPKIISFVSPKMTDVDYVTVTDFIALGRSPYTNYFGKIKEIDHEIINQSAELIGVTHLLNRYTSDLSDGEKQLVAIAKVIAQETPYIILDEPTAFLDYKNKTNVIEKLMHASKKLGKTILIASHDVELCIEQNVPFIVVNHGEVNLFSAGITKQELIKLAYD